MNNCKLCFEEIDISGINNASALKGCIHSLFFSIFVTNVDEDNKIIIIEIMVIENNSIEVVIKTFVLLLLLDINLAITVGRESCVRFIKKTILGLTNIYNPVASIPTTLVVVTLATVAIIFTMTLMHINETIDLRSGLFCKFLTLSY